MAGFDLKEGYYIKKQLTEDELWSIFSAMFSSKAVHDTSYKFGFFKSILDSLYNADDIEEFCMKSLKNKNAFTVEKN